MNTHQVERLLLLKLAQAPTPELPFRWELYQDDFLGKTEPAPPLLSVPPKTGWIRAAALTGAAAVGITSAAILVNPHWRNGISSWLGTGWPNSGIHAPESSRPAPFSPSSAPNSTNSSAVPGGSSQTISDPLLAELAGYLPGVQAEHLYSSPQWMGIQGHFTQTDAAESVYLLSYQNAEEANELPRYYLLLDTGEEVLVKEFAFEFFVAITSIGIQDLTGNGLDEIVVSIHEGGSSRGEALFIFTAADKKIELLLSTIDQTRFDKTAPAPFDFGFTSECLPGYRALIRNRFTNQEWELDLSASRGLPAAFDEEGRGLSLIDYDLVTDYGFEAGEEKGKTEIRCGIDAWFSIHAETVCYLDAYLVYDQLTGSFRVNRAEIHPAV